LSLLTFSTQMGSTSELLRCL